MPRTKRSNPLSPTELAELWDQAVLTYQPHEPEMVMPAGIQTLYSILTQEHPRNAEEMFCLIMYDIENNRVRTLVAKYLEKKGCIRVQKSIFFAKIHRTMYHDITDTLRQIQATYDNNDSIILLPVAEDMLNKLACIGKEFEWEILTASRHTLFF